MRAEALTALVVSESDSFCHNIADCLKWVGAEKVVRVRTGAAAQSELKRKRFTYSVLVIQIEEDKTYDVDFIEGIINGRDLASRSIRTVAVAAVRTKNFYVELQRLGFHSLVLTPISRALLRKTLLGIFQSLQSEFRNPEISLLRRALQAGDLEYVEERCMRALQHQPDHRIYSAYLGEVYFRKNEFEKALAKAEAAIAAAGLDGAADAHRLKAKALLKLGRKDECYAQLPYVMKDAEKEKYAILGLIPALNSYATQLKSSGQIEEALLYYGLALSESDARPHLPQLHLNIALARLAANSVRLAYDAAKTSLGASFGKFAKARDLIAYIEKNHGAELNANDSDENYDVVVEASEEAVLEQEFEHQKRAAPKDTDSARRAASVNELADLEASLVEELDFPVAAQTTPPSAKAPSVKDTVFAMMENLGSDAGSAQALTDSGQSAAEPASLDDLGDSFGLDLSLDAADMDFDVSPEEIAAAQAAREQEAELSRMAAQSENASDSDEDSEESNDFASPLDDVLGAALSMEKEPSVYPDETDSTASADVDVLSLLEDPELVAKMRQISNKNEPALPGASHDDDHILANEDSQRLATDEEFAEFISAAAVPNKPEPKQENAKTAPTQDFDAFEALMAEVSEVSEPAAAEQNSALESGPLAEVISVESKRKDQNSLSKAESLSNSEKSKESKEKDPNAQDKESSKRPKWDKMTEEELLAYVMFEQEYPRIKYKLLKVQPVKKAAAS